MYFRKRNTSKQRSTSSQSTVITMVSKKNQDLVETALEQLIVAGFQSRGMEPQEAQLAGRATMIGLGVVDKAIGSAQKTQRAVGRTVKKTAKRELNSWQKYVKANKNKHKYKSGSKKGQVNFKALSRAFKKTPAGRKKK
jgi:hypothetical protein